LFNRLITERFAQDPWPYCIQMATVAFEAALILMLAGVRPTASVSRNPGLTSFFAVLLALAGAVLAVSLIFRMHARFTSVSDRDHELGILRMLGAPPSWLLSLSLQETLLVVVPGMMLGILAALAISLVVLYTVPEFLNFTVSVQWLPLCGAIPAACDFFAAWLALRRQLGREVLESISSEE
jgi:predicted lysophospholipase L1 biosynthesis ABC-type transport system permease subunit